MALELLSPAPLRQSAYRLAADVVPVADGSARLLDLDGEFFALSAELRYEGVNRVMAGGRLEVDPNGFNVVRWWDWLAHVEQPERLEHEPIAERFGVLLRDAIEQRRVGRTAAHLSGGMDSTAVALLAAQQAHAAGDEAVHGLSTVYERFPVLARAVAGALIMLALFDWVLVPTALALLVPVTFLSYRFGRVALGINGQLNDELEREVDVIGRGQAEEIHGHYSRVRGCRIRLTDRAALNFGLMEFFGFGLMAAALIRCCTVSALDPGQIFAIFGYILIFSQNLTNVPLLIEQVSRLRDICRRFSN